MRRTACTGASVGGDIIVDEVLVGINLIVLLLPPCDANGGDGGWRECKGLGNGEVFVVLLVEAKVAIEESCGVGFNFQLKLALIAIGRGLAIFAGLEACMEAQGKSVSKGSL